MTSIYEHVLGESFTRLHPLLQRKFGLSSADEQMILGQGTMDNISGGAFWYRPFFRLFRGEHILFAERGQHVPFTIENYAYTDEHGREKVSWIRRFHFPSATRAFDAVMYLDRHGKQIMDAFGRNGRLLSPLSLRVTEDGGLHIHADRAFFRKPNGALLNIPRAFAPRADVYERVDSHNRLHIHVHIASTFPGTILSYSGTVDTTYRPLQAAQIPPRKKL